MIVVKLFAFFRDNRGKELEIIHQQGITIRDIVKDLGIEENLVAISLINGRHQALDYEINDGEKVYLFPPVAGG